MAASCRDCREQDSAASIQCSRMPGTVLQKPLRCRSVGRHHRCVVFLKVPRVMTTPEIVGAVIAALGGQAFFLAAAGWLVKTVIDTQVAKEMEGFKTNLAMEAHRRTTVFGRLHERRAIVIARVYKLASRAAQAISSMVVPMQQSGDADSVRLAGVSVKAIEAFRDRFAANRVWFPAACC